MDKKTSAARRAPDAVDVTGKKVYVVSDLHMAAGMKDNGNYDGTENFFADDSFGRFLDHLQKKVSDTGGVLIINGDFIDFLRVTTIPNSPDDFRCWHEALQNVGIHKSVEDLSMPELIDDKERKYGLKTQHFKSIWKLYVCVKGHSKFFKRLAEWVADGNDLIVVKGNHDLEWYWQPVQQYLRVALEKALAADHRTGDHRATMAARVRFCDDALILNNRVYIEHGHFYDPETCVEGTSLLDNGEELRLPFGSFFNRYLINQLELSYPFLDNVRPTQNILAVLIKEKFLKALEVLFRYIPFTLKMIPKNLTRYTLKYLFNFVFIMLIPIVVFVYAAAQVGKEGGFNIEKHGLVTVLFNVLKCVGFLLLSYLIGQLLARLRFKKPVPFSARAKEILHTYPSVEAVLFGHTHDPEQNNLLDEESAKRGEQNQWYFNTGTWIPIFETTSASVRYDKTYTFIAVDLAEKQPCRERLQRWNDDAERVDSMVLNERVT